MLLPATKSNSLNTNDYNDDDDDDNDNDDAKGTFSDCEQGIIFSVFQISYFFFYHV